MPLVSTEDPIPLILWKPLAELSLSLLQGSDKHVTEVDDRDGDSLAATVA